MDRHDPRVDDYLARSAEFETLKWGAPSYTYRGRILCSMAAFKQHASFGFWQHAQVMGEDAQRDGMGSFGRMSSPKDAPSARTLAPLLRKAMRLIDEGVPTARTRRTGAPRPPASTPPDLQAALRRNAAARRTFEAFPPSHRREYIDWLEEARREETRQKRLAQALEWLAEGKSRHWKYQRG
jgi:uncharacterized protein YdeI (YjbR/CyaY-like superfamily)